MLDKNRWRACLLPDNYQRKLRQDLAETDTAADLTFGPVGNILTP
jgi:hypothetical protein